MGDVFDRITSLVTLTRAFDRVEENHGCAGIDGVTVELFASGLDARLIRLRDELLADRYRPDALLRVRIPKSEGKTRPLSIPTVRDRVAQTAAALVLTPILDPEFEEVSFAYREGRSVDQAVRRVLNLRDQGYQWVVDADIRSYFDEIPHDKLLTVLGRYVNDERAVALVERWLTVDIVEGSQRVRLERGVPQGSPLSPLLANLYLDRFDEAFIHRGHKLVRFADDFIVLCRTQPDAQAALEMSEEVLARLRLTLNPQKTRVTHFDHGFRYLGVQFLRSLAFRPESESQEPAGETARTGHEPVPPSPSAALPGGRTPMADAMRRALKGFPADEAARKWEALTEDRPEADLPPIESTWGHDPVLRTLFLMEQGAELRKQDERFVVRKAGRTLAEVPAIKVDQIMVFGNVALTTPAMQFCLLEKIPVYLLSSRGRYYGTIESAADDSLSLHRDQFARAADSDFSLALSKAMVRGKIANARTLLQRAARRTGRASVRDAALALQSMLDRVESVRNVDELRGYEGAAAAEYFSVWPDLIGAGWHFQGRKRQPPPDPVNSLLSFGYTLLFYNTYSLLRAGGLHPGVGFYHAMRQGHPALVSDLMEEFRAPVVDATVLAMLHRKQVTSADFREPDEPGMPCLLTDEARRTVTKAFESTLNRGVLHPDAGGRCDYRRAIGLQARRLVGVVRGEQTAYQPFLTR